VISLSGRNVLLVAGAAVIACAALVAFFVAVNVAQGPPPGGAAPPGGMPGPGGGMPGGGMPGGPGMSGMPGGMGGMPGGGGAAGGGGTFKVEETAPPEHLQKTYEEFLAEEGVARVPIPKAYVLDDQGKPKKLSANQWYQLTRIYQEGVAEAKVEKGRVGGKMADQVRAELDHMEREYAAIRELYEWGVNHCFTAKVSQPVLETVSSGSGDTATLRVHVVLQASRKDLPTRVAKRLQPLSVPGMPWRDSAAPGPRIGSAAGRARMDIVTREGGFTKPVKLYLDAQAIGLWNQLWSDTDVRISLLDPGGKPLAEQTLGTGFDGGIGVSMLYPQDCWPASQVHAMPDISPWGTKLKMLGGATKDLYDLKGWLIGGTGGLHFTLPVGTLATLDGAQVDLVPAEGLKEVRLAKIGG
jgi:hypothetical protein